MAGEEGGSGRGRPGARRPDDGARARGQHHLRPGDAAGRHPGVGGDAVHVGPFELCTGPVVAQRHDRRPHTGRLR